MKKVLTLMVAFLVFMLFVAGCAAPQQATQAQTASKSTSVSSPVASLSSGEASTVSKSEPTSESTKDKQMVFGYLTFTRSDVWNNCSADAFIWAAKQVGVKVMDIECEGKMEKQIDGMETLINEKVDGVSIYSITPESDVDLSKMADAAGIPTVIENSMPGEGCKSTSVACYDYDKLGYECGLYMADVWKGKKVFLCLGALGMNIIEPWEEGFNRAMKEKGNNFDVAGKQYTDWGTEKAMNVTQDFISSGTKFDALFACNGQMYAGCMAALEDANLLDKVETMTEGGNDDELKWVREGKHEYVLAVPPNIQGIAVFKALWMYKNGETPPATFDLPATRVSKVNIDKAPTWTNNELALEMLGGLKKY